MLAGVQIEHQGRQRPLQPRTGTEVGGEARTGDLGAALEVENAELGAQVPVRPGLEAEVARLADLALLAVRLFVCPHRHRVVRQVGQRQLDVVELPLELGGALVLCFDLALELTDGLDLLVGAEPLRLELADLLAALGCAGA